MNRLLVLVLFVAALSNTGCYYSHLASGQLKILWARQPIEAAIASPETSAQTADLLRLVGEARAFATDLGLDVSDQYTSFVDWPGDRIVTTVVRARPNSVEAVPFRYPILGALPYRGYFDRSRAEAFAEQLREEEAFDVCVSGVSAYSTLGWIDDPVTSPMLRRGAVALVETILHELVHATVFYSDQVDFNESVAQFIGQEAAIQFFAAPRPASLAASDFEWPAADRVRALVLDRRIIGEEVSTFRSDLDRFFEAASEGDPFDPEALAVLRETGRERLSALPLSVLDAEKIASRTRLTNACLALRGSYVEDLPRHAGVLDALGGNLIAMIDRLRRIESDGGGPEDFYSVSSGGVEVGVEP